MFVFRPIQHWENLSFE